MSRRALAAGVAFGLVATLAGGQAALAGPGRNTGGEHPGKGRDGGRGEVRRVHRHGPPPATPEQKADVYSSAKIKVTYANRRTQILDLAYHQLMATGETVNGKVVGGLLRRERPAAHRRQRADRLRCPRTGTR